MIITHNNYKIFKKSISKLLNITIKKLNTISKEKLKELILVKFKNIFKNYDDEINFFSISFTNILIEIYTKKKYKKKISNSKILENYCELIREKMNISFKYDMPYIAGYSIKEFNFIYIDKDIKKVLTKKEINSIILHEFIEKMIIQNEDTKHLGYVYSHQIAQQIEYYFYTDKEADNFQHKIDKIEILLLEKLNNKDIVLPKDLCLLPYEELGDLSIIKRNSIFI